MASGIKTGQFTSWVIAGAGLVTGVILMKTAINFAKGFIPIPLADA